jgi:hypothetical protein
VRTYEGDPKHVEDGNLDNAKGQGRKIVVTFADGEVICGFTTGYSKDKQGFFVIPVDPKSNNSASMVTAGEDRMGRRAGGRGLEPPAGTLGMAASVEVNFHRGGPSFGSGEQRRV